ncbi:hypothetical protein ANO11243_042570 [Dothideomycetidae sp. 11243]|nr:hypothetical protein ANO11243_042570 [fungal sp. No.11243]
MIYLFGILSAVTLLLMQMSSNAPELADPPYDEATIVSLMTQIYESKLKLGVILPGDVIFAPPGGHNIDLSEISNVPLDSKVTSLMKRMPLPRYGAEFDFVLGARPVPYLDKWHLARSRDVNRFKYNAYVDSLDNTNVRSHDLAILQEASRDGFWMILDTNANSAKQIGHARDRKLLFDWIEKGAKG